MSQQVDVALVWHMHQPWYVDGAGETFVLPWVRRRAAKDYLHMLRVLERHPSVLVTMNVVPSLLEQLHRHATGSCADVDRELSLRDAADVTPAERSFLIATARHNDYGRRVALLRPFMDLLDRLGSMEPGEVSLSDVRDLQLWNLLAWIDPEEIRADSDLRELAERGAGFGEGDKAVVDDRQMALVRAVIPAYAAAVARGQVEPMTSPYHHPILPLLIDSDAALLAHPDGRPLRPPLRAEEDAVEQVRRGLDLFAERTGHRAAGMWPAECAVSPRAAALLHECGAGFAVSDEGVLVRTLGRDVRADGALYRVHRDAGGLPLVFRDAQLSNLIGFAYQHLDAVTAATDLVGRLTTIAAGSADRRLVTIALDGENFKDYFDENGTPFLDALYARLETSSQLRPVHLRPQVDEAEAASLPELWTGSWIDADLRTWAGGDAHRRAWSLLRETRAAVVAAGGPGAHPQAHDEVLVAEASDWFWWFSEQHDSGFDEAWDALFRSHLRAAHTLAGLDVPAAVDEPIVTRERRAGVCPPLRSINPQPDAPAEWGCAGIAEVGTALGAMHPPRSSVGRVYFGAGGGRLHLRFGDAPPRFDRAVIDAGAAGVLVVDHATRNVTVPLVGDHVDVSVTLEEQGRGVERVPPRGSLRVLSRRRGLRVLVVAVECAPVAVAGGLAARVAASVAASAGAGHEVVAVVPRHRHAAWTGAGVRIAGLAAGTEGAPRARVLQSALPSGAPVLGVDAPWLFDRDAVYGSADDCERYLGFCRLVDALIGATGFAPDIVHAFEWQTAGLVALLADRASGVATVFSAAADAPSMTAPAGALELAGVDAEGGGGVDLLSLGRHRAAVTGDGDGEETAALYAAALARGRGS